MRIALAILISSLAISAQADGIYKWVDENGVVHFGSQPPQKEEVEVVKKPRSERYKQWQAEQRALDAKQRALDAAQAAEQATSTERAVAAEPAQQQEAEQEKALTQAQMAVRAQRCNMARSNLQELQSHARVREVGPDGKMRVLPEEERQQRIAQAQQRIRDNC